MTASITATAAPTPLAVCEAIPRDAAGGRRAALTTVDDAGRVRRVDPRHWCGGLVDGDAALLDRWSGCNQPSGSWGTTSPYQTLYFPPC